MAETDLQQLYNRLSRMPFGKVLFSRLVCRKAPYFKTIKPLIEIMDQGEAVVRVRETRALHNHLQTMHAIVLCNMCELAMGMAVESSIPARFRWIPKGMTVNYLKPGKGELKAVSLAREGIFIPGDVTVPVHIFDHDDVEVMNAEITLHITEKKNKKPSSGKSQSS